MKKYVNYEDFGAIGDGKHDDFDAIAAAHAYANENALEIMARGDAVYYVGERFTHPIEIEYSVDFNGASFIVDDTVPNAYEYRSNPLFMIKRKRSLVLYGDELAEKIGDNVKISRQDIGFEWLAPLLDEDSYVRITNEDHRDFVRFGSNQNSGIARKDVFIVKKNGELAPETSVAFEFDKITQIEIFPEREELITVKNGNFASICCRVTEHTGFKNVYRSYSRGFRVERSDVTFENMTHRMIDEPPFITDSGKDALCERYAERTESYPYQGFIIGMLANRLTIKDCLLTSHTTYYEDKPATVSTGWKVPNPVPMGSYDYYFHYSNAVSLINVKQDCPTGIGDTRYWGIMASNNCKNFVLDGCYVNRFDAHQGFWNAVIKNSTIGHSINITGGGYLYMENVTKLVGYSMMSIRGDYGGSFEGDIVLKNCRLAARRGYNTSIGQKESEETFNECVIIDPGKGGNMELFYNWDFGYELFHPINITVENFTHGSCGELYLFEDQVDEKYKNNHKHCHRPPKSITFIGMEKVPKITKSEECTVLRSVPVTVKHRQC